MKEKLKNKENILLLLIVLMTLVSVAYVLGKHSIRLTPRDNDFRVYYNGSRLLFEGDATTTSLIMPWAKVIILTICPSFLPYNIAFWYFYLILTIATVYLGCLIYKWVSKHSVFTETWKNILISICITILPMNWHDTLDMTNLGGLIAILSLIAVFLAEEHPIVSAVLLAVAMSKPQIVGVFVAMLFFMKKFKPVFVAAAIDIISWISSIIITKIITIGKHLETNTLADTSGANDIVNMYANGGESGEVPFFTYGIFDPLKHLGVSRVAILLISALFGLGLIIMFLYFTKEYRGKLETQENVLFMGSITAIASIVWCYKTPCDEIIVIISGLLLMTYWINSQKEIKDILIVAAAFAALNMKIFIFWIKQLTGMEHTLAIFSDDALKLLTITIITALVIKNNKGSTS